MTGNADVGAFLVADQNGVVVDANDAACRLFGRPKSEILGLSLAPHSAPDILEALGARWLELRTLGAIYGTAEIERSDGSTETIDFTAQRDLPVMGWTLVRLEPSSESARS